MHYFGYLVYALVVACFIAVPAANNLITSSYQLASWITVGCVILAFYPLLMFIYYHVTKSADKSSLERFSSVSQTCGHTVVSLGLIGTFIGLTQMIKQIAAAIGVEGSSLDEQIALIMGAIGDSLAAMSYAFLTSVMGVAASVVIFIAGIYFKSYFDNAAAADSSAISNEDLEARLVAIEADNAKLRQFFGRIIDAQVGRKEMASIIVNSNHQIEALSKATFELNALISSQCHLSQASLKELSTLANDVRFIVKNQEDASEFMAQSCEALSRINSLKEDALVIQRAQAVGIKSISECQAEILKLQVESCAALGGINALSEYVAQTQEENTSRAEKAIEVIVSGLKELKS